MRQAPTRRRLYRSREHRWIAGVAGGIAEYFRIDPLIVRVAWVIVALIAAPMTLPLAVAVYALLAFTLPSEPAV